MLLRTVIASGFLVANVAFAGPIDDFIAANPELTGVNSEEMACGLMADVENITITNTYSEDEVMEAEIPASLWEFDAETSQVTFSFVSEDSGDSYAIVIDVDEEMNAMTYNFEFNVEETVYAESCDFSAE